MKTSKIFIFLVVLSIILIKKSKAQSVRINEVVSSNSIHLDEDGDTPDWLELHNFGATSVSLNGWSLSDDELDLGKWTFPNITLAADEYLLIWASSKNRSTLTQAKTFINRGDNFKYLIPTSEPNSAWKNTIFDDTSWSTGTSGFGYADGDDTTIIPTGTQSIYLRKEFSITDISTINSLILDMDFDDAFVAYINGTEIARANINGSPPSYNSGTIQDHEAKIYQGGKPDRFLISNYQTVLKTGKNVLTIQAHNVSGSSSDFTVIPFLSAIYNGATPDGITPPSILSFNNSKLFHTNFKISSKKETLILSTPSAEIIDKITVENMPPDTSVGVSVTSGKLVTYANGTPGAKNSSIEYLGTVASEVLFSHKGGLTSAPINLTLSGNKTGEVIRYAFGGVEPTISSPIYTSPIAINTNKNIRARIFATNYLPSPIYTKTYVFNAIHQLDIVFLSTDPKNFYDQNTGIYILGNNYDPAVPYFGANFWQDWERPIHVAFLENSNGELIEFDAGVKIYGGWSRGQNAQRSLSLFARGKYGFSEFKHSFFDELSYKKFESLVLRNSGQDWLKSSIKDVMITSLMRGSGLDFQEHTPVATYLNGAYFGMYNLREKNNEHMLASKHDLDADDITILTNNAEIVEGDNAEYNQLINYISTVDLSKNINFKYVEDRVDLTEYALYQATNVYINNTDWPGNNIKYWKHPSGKWRWIMYDTDFGYGPFWKTENYDENALNFALDATQHSWPNPAWSTLLFRKLLTNIGFRNKFINRYADELNSRFLPANIKAHIDKVYNVIKHENTAHYTRWEGNVSDALFFTNKMKNFAEKRPSFAKNHIKSKFNLPGSHIVTIKNSTISSGFVNINDNLKIQNTTWSGEYFQTVPIELKAIAEKGFEFSHWSGAVSSTQEIISIDLTTNQTVTTHFKAVTEKPIVINEINYKSSDNFNADDWVELYNPNAVAIDLSGWKIKDDTDANVFIIPNGTKIDADGYLVFVKDNADFLAVFPKITNIIGNIGLKFGGSDSVRLFNKNDILQDEVAYLSDDPWVTCADGNGQTLELINPSSDNSLAESWKCINVNGSPNAKNILTLSVTNNEFLEVVIYPNPVKDTLYIEGDLESFKIEIFSVTGQLISSFENTKKNDVSNLKQGVYFVKTLSKGKQKIVNFIKY